MAWGELAGLIQRESQEARCSHAVVLGGESGEVTALLAGTPWAAPSAHTHIPRPGHFQRAGRVLTALPAIDLMVDLWPDVGQLKRRWQRQGAHLEPGGLWLCPVGESAEFEALAQRLNHAPAEYLSWRQPKRRVAKAVPDRAAVRLLRAREPQLRVRRVARLSGGGCRGGAPTPTTGYCAARRCLSSCATRPR